MSRPKVVVPPEIWVELYATLANHILEYSSLDNIWVEDEAGNETRTPEKQDEFEDIVDTVEDIMRGSGLVKGGI
jgi:hypothetical protein